MLYRNITTPDRPVPFTVRPDEYDRGTRFIKPKRDPRNETISLLICTAFAAVIAVWMWMAGA